MGGGMRQAGYIAAAAKYALENNVERLKIDNDHAKLLGQTLEKCTYVDNVRPVKTNIVIFDVKPPHTSESILAKLDENGILASPFGPMTVRLVTHLDVSEAMIHRTIEVLKSL